MARRKNVRLNNINSPVADPEFVEGGGREKTSSGVPIMSFIVYTLHLSIERYASKWAFHNTMIVYDIFVENGHCNRG